MQYAKLIFMTGKGGVGKTTLCAHLSQAAATNGLRSLVVEVNDSKQIPFLFNLEPKDYVITEIQENLSCISVNPESAIEEYILKQIKSRRLFKLAFQNRFIQPLLNGAPGLHHAVQMGKIYDLCISGDWDVIFIDAPATGHGITMLEAARHMMELTQIGPLFEANKQVDKILSDPSITGVLLMCTPEGLPVSECIELYYRLPKSRQNAVIGVIVNQHDSSLSQYGQLPIDNFGSTAKILHEQFYEHEEQVKRLKSNLDVPVQSYPFQVWSKTVNVLDGASALFDLLLEGFLNE